MVKKIYILTCLVLLLSANLSYSEEGISWEECMHIAIGNNPELISASEKVKQAKKDKDIDLSSMLPRWIAKQVVKEEKRQPRRQQILIPTA